MKQFILRIPEGTTAESFDEETQAAIRAVNGQFPKGVVVGSQAVGGYEIKLVLANSTTDELENQFVLLSLDWEVLAEEGVESNADLILPYMLPVEIFDEEGDLISSEALVNLDSLQIYAGHKWTWQ